MPKEIRAILFTTDEVRSVVEHFLHKGSAARKAQPVSKVELEVVNGNLHGRAHVGRGADAKLTMLGPQELMTAVLMYCGHLRIPLSSRAAKLLESSATGLMLTMSLNPDPSGPRVTGNAIEYSAPMPAALKEAAAAVQE